jgi:hypothetical protein
MFHIEEPHETFARRSSVEATRFAMMESFADGYMGQEAGGRTDLKINDPRRVRAKAYVVPMQKVLYGLNEMLARCPQYASIIPRFPEPLEKFLCSEELLSCYDTCSAVLMNGGGPCVLVFYTFVFRLFKVRYDLMTTSVLQKLMF